ncbi:hypothetical protein BaRGS_00037325, partial [Batillaria attramentaria]
FVTCRPERRGSCLLLCGDFNGVGCPSGYSCQSNGCGSECFNTSFVQPAGCAPFECESRCSLGYKRDSNGCQYCECDYSAIQISPAEDLRHHDDFRVAASWDFCVPDIQFERDGIPGPKPSFLFGNLKEFVGVDPLQKFVQLTKKYGKVFGYFEGLTPSVVVSDPVLIEQILVKHFNSFDGRPISYPLLHGPETLWLQNINGAVWKQQRDALAPVFKATSIAKILPRIQTTADSYVKNLERARKEHPHGFDIRDINQQYSLDSFMSTVFDMDLDFLPSEDKTLFLQYMLAAHYSASPENPLCGLSPGVYPSLAPVFRLLDRPHKRLTEQFSRRLSDYISTETPKVFKSRDVSGLLHHLLSAHVTHHDLAKNNNSVHVPLTEDEVKGQMMGLVGGGVGTALSALHYCTHCLALHQDVQRKVREEVDEVCGGDFSQDISLDDVYRMEYLDMFINETLRHYPVAPGVARTCAEDCVVGGFQFRKGTVLRLLGSTQYMDPEIFPEPEAFRPERFSKEEREKRHAYSWFPFGSGPRMCVARRLGLLQVKMALVRLVQHFEVRTSDHTHDPLPSALRPFLTPTADVHVRLVSRDK